MTKRRNLFDDIYGDRSEVRAHSAWLDSRPSHSNLGKFSQGYKPCYESHKPLPLPKSKAVIFGGSCSTPVVQDADIYIGFERSMQRTVRQFPWEDGYEILFYVEDMGVPYDVENYVKLVQWTKEQLEAGKKVHAGCIGGHGRTGMFFAALVSLYGELDAITYVREHYCPKAVESTRQVTFLADVFGVVPVQPTKESAQSKSKVVAYASKEEKSKPKEPKKPQKVAVNRLHFSPVKNAPRRIW